MVEGARRRPGIVLWTLTAVAVIAHLVRPSGPVGDTTYLLVVLSAPLVAALGARSSPPGRRRVATLIAAGLAASGLGDVVWDLYYWYGGNPDVSLADIPYYISYVFLVAALLTIAIRHQHGTRRINIDAAIDALTVLVVSVLLFWDVAARDVLSDTSLPVSTRLVLSGYPVMDAVLLALVLRMLSVRRYRQAISVGFAAGLGCWLASDVGYLLPWDSDAFSAVLDAGWMAGAMLMATSAWHRPSRHPQPAEPERTERRPLGQLGLAVLPLLVPLGLMVLTDLQGREIHAGSGVAAYLVVLAVTVLRIWRLLTAEAEMRRDLAVARDDALAASVAKSSFLATMSHEIRTPINGVIGLNELLLTTDLDERQRQYAEGARIAGQGLLEIINEILDFSKIESGHLELEEIDFDVVALVEGVAAILGEPAQAKGLELLAYCSPEVPSGLRGDPSKIRQVLLNLAGNALKFTPTGEVVVRVALDDQGPDDQLVVRFEVSDTGIGLAEEDRERLFEPFSQADASTTRRYGGTGLGLSISRQLVRAMGGELGVDSSLGVGSTFWFTLPLTHSRAGTEPPPPSSLAGLHVLVVDDNATNRTILRDQLRHWGMTVDVVDAAEPALEALRDAAEAGRRYDLGVFDLCMPDVDGLELARRVAADPVLAGTIVVMMTSGPVVTEAEARAASISAALTKPVLMSKMQRTLDRVVADRVSGESVAEPEAAEPGSRGVVLVVDDSEVNQLVAMGMLSYLGYTAEVAEDGREALALLEHRQFDAILMDVQMPEMDGYEATQEIRRLEAGSRRTPIIAMTASVTDGERERCRSAGMDDYLGKPMERKDVLAVLERWVPAS